MITWSWVLACLNFSYWLWYTNRTCVWGSSYWSWWKVTRIQSIKYEEKNWSRGAWKRSEWCKKRIKNQPFVSDGECNLFDVKWDVHRIQALHLELAAVLTPWLHCVMRMDEKIKIQLPFFNQDLLTHFFFGSSLSHFQNFKNWFKLVLTLF